MFEPEIEDRCPECGELEECRESCPETMGSWDVQGYYGGLA